MNFPKRTVKRLCEIYNILNQLSASGREIVFSNEISSRTGIPSYLIRKDINFCGRIGRPGRGYMIKSLKDHISRYLNLEKEIRTAIVGVGRLGRSILNSNGFSGNIKYICAFDRDPNKVGTRENGIPVFSSNKMLQLLKKNRIEIGVVAVPNNQVQPVINILAEGGVTCILAFADIPVKAPEGISLKIIDFIVEMEVLSVLNNSEINLCSVKES